MNIRNLNEVKSIEIKSSLIARNTVLNFIGQIIPLIIGVAAIPFIIKGLGIERFGLLSLAWVILGYFAIFDLGLGRATTKYVAEALGKSEEDQIPRLVWTAVTVQATLGFIGALVLLGITPLLVERILNIPLELIGEAKAVFYLLALSIPLVLVSGSFAGVLEAKQRFDLVNAVRVPSSALTFLLPLVGLFLGFHLPGIVALILIARFGALSALVILNLRILPNLRTFSASFFLFPRLFAYGGWITVSNIVGPILVYLDRFLIASLLSMAAVAYYTAPYEAVTRLWIIPASLVMSLFPAFSALEGSGDRQRLEILFARSVKYALLVLGPIVLMLVMFAQEFLQIWLGGDFAMQSKAVLQILALGVLVNSLANIPYSFLQGVGRPDITAKFHLLELPIYIGLVWFLIKAIGLPGAALAWTLRVGLDTLLLFGASWKLYRIDFRVFAGNGLLRSSAAISAFAAILAVLSPLKEATSIQMGLVVFVLVIALFGWIIWHYVLDTVDKNVFNSFFKQVFVKYK